MLKTFARGIHPAYHKELASDKAIETPAVPKRVVIPMRQHIGAPCKALVKRGDVVEEGQKIGDVESFISAPVHASISGKVKDVTMHPHPGGGKAVSVIIEGDGLVKDWGGGLFDAHYLDDKSPDELRSAIRKAGVVGLGGASFPTFVKLMPPKEKKIDCVILNGCECEPYLTADHRIMLEDADKIVLGLKAIMKSVGATDGYIGIEANKQDTVSVLEEAISRYAAGVKVAVLETKYPQGAEKMLIDAILGRKVPSGKLPLDVGVVVNNVGTAASIFEAVAYGKPIIERVVTVTGGGVQSAKNIRARIGTTFADMIEICGGLSGSDALSERAVLNGGPMMGIAQSTLDVPVIKGTSGITVLFARNVKPVTHRSCIRCASCVSVCPIGLMPYRIADQGRLDMTDDFKLWSGLDCIECGCCSFLCPSKRPLVQWIRVGKITLREAERVKAEQDNK